MPIAQRANRLQRIRFFLGQMMINWESLQLTKGKSKRALSLDDRMGDPFGAILRFQLCVKRKRFGQFGEIRQSRIFLQSIPL